MQVIHIASGDMPIQPTGSGGVQKDLYFLTKYLSQLECDVGVIDINSEMHRKLQTRAKIHTVWNPPIAGEVCGTPSHIIKVFIFSILATFKLSRLLKKDKIDIVHTHGQFPAAAMLLFKWFFKRFPPIVHTIHNAHILMNPTKLNKVKHFLEILVLNNVDLVITETETGRNSLESEFGLDSDKIMVVPQGLDLSIMDQYIKDHSVVRKEDKKDVVLCVGRICPRKNQLVLIKAAPRVLQRFPDTKFMFVGPIENRSYFHKMSYEIENQKLDSPIGFTGELRGDALYESYKNATVFAFPTLYETQGVVLLESMAFGLPVIASKIGPIEDVVGLEKDSALLVNPSNINGIADAIIQLLGDKSFREKLAIRGRNLVSQNFSWPQIAHKMLRVYKDLLYSRKERKKVS